LVGCILTGKGGRNYKYKKVSQGMKTFAEFMVECSIDESSLSRIKSKSDKGGMAILSRSRGDKSDKENKKRHGELKRRVRGAGLPGGTNVKGRYTETGRKSESERSLVVTPGKSSKRKFKKKIEKLGTEQGMKHKKNFKGSSKDNQDSVLIQRKKKGEASVKGTSKKAWPGKGKNVSQGKMKPGRKGVFDTQVKKKTFTYEK